jgi:hypothetical protein
VKECISANKMNKMAITRNVILVALLLAPFFRPNGINWILPGGQYVYDLLSMVSLLILLAVYLAGKRQTIDFQWIVFGFMLVVIMFQTQTHCINVSASAGHRIARLYKCTLSDHVSWRHVSLPCYLRSQQQLVHGI